MGRALGRRKQVVLLSMLLGVLAMTSEDVSAASLVQVRAQLEAMHLRPPPLFPRWLPGPWHHAVVSIESNCSCDYSIALSWDGRLAAAFRRGAGRLLSEFIHDKRNGNAIRVIPVRIGRRRAYLIMGRRNYLAWKQSGRTYWLLEKWYTDGSVNAELRLYVPFVRSLAEVVPPPRRYVALGDSFSSGEGAVDARGDAKFETGTAVRADQCHRSAHAYPNLVSRSTARGDTFTFRACSGAVIADLVAKLPGAGGWNEGAQLAAISPANRPDVSVARVTLSVGGNDAGFPAVLTKCVHGFRWPFNNGGSDQSCLDFAKAELKHGIKLMTGGGKILFNTKDGSWSFCGAAVICKPAKPGATKEPVTVPSLAALYKEIHRRAPNAAIRVLLYPHLFGAAPPAQCQLGTFHSPIAHTYTMSRTVTAELNSLGDQLDTDISGQVAAAAAAGINIATADGRSPFNGHGLCDSHQAWINGLRWDGHFLWDVSPFSFHPTADGQAALAKVMNH